MDEADKTAKWTPLLELARQRRQPLLTMLAKQAQGDKYTPLEVALILGVPVMYLHHLYAGLRDVSFCTDEVTQRLSEYLEVPVVTIRCAAGFIRYEDFFTENGMEKSAVAAVQARPEWAELLAGQPALVQAFAGMLSGMDIPDSNSLRDAICDGPAWISTPPVQDN